MRFFYIFLLVGMLTSCQSFKEIHYFKDKAGDPPNYYRLKVKGHASLTSSRYLSGYFDINAVDDYFSEVVQPKNAKFTPNANVVESIDPTKAGKKFVMLLSTNSEAIAAQLGNFVQTQATLEAVAKLVNQDKVEEYNAAKTKSKKLDNDFEEIILLGDEYLKSLGPTSSRAETEAKLLAMVNRLVKKFGHEDFLTLADAATWYRANRQTLTR
jgi:hypothetical protein